MKTASAPGKIILTGEYAVVFGYPGIAIPAPLHMTVSYEEDSNTKDLMISWPEVEEKPEWQQYMKQVIALCGTFGGTLKIDNQIPLGKGMGASTALVIAVVRCLIGDNKEKALTIEDTVNPGHSGIDFAVIWNEKPIKFTKGLEPEFIELPKNITSNFSLIDTGAPQQQTPELIAWVTERKDDLDDAFASIGACSDRLLSGEDILDVIRDHHQVQVSIGIVTDKAKNMIKKIEQEGGAAKVIGAGSRTGGCGMVLVYGIEHPRIEQLTSRILTT